MNPAAGKCRGALSKLSRRPAALTATEAGSASGQHCPRLRATVQSAGSGRVANGHVHASAAGSASGIQRERDPEAVSPRVRVRLAALSGTQCARVISIIKLEVEGQAATKMPLTAILAFAHACNHDSHCLLGVVRTSELTPWQPWPGAPRKLPATSNSFTTATTRKRVIGRVPSRYASDPYAKRCCLTERTTAFRPANVAFYDHRSSCASGYDDSERWIRGGGSPLPARSSVRGLCKA
jgi:hypothetical protein